MALRPFRSATKPVVPAPPKGSRTVPSLGHPARTHGVIKSGGNTAKCAPVNGFVVTVQTERLFLPSGWFNDVPSAFNEPLCPAKPLPAPP